MQLLMDEHIDAAFRVQLRGRLPDLMVSQIGDADVPPKGTPDPDILIWCEEHDFHLVTNNRKSMPVHLADHLAAGRHIPGILNIDLSEPMGVLLQELQDIVELSLPDEYRDRIQYFPTQ